MSKSKAFIGWALVVGGLAVAYYLYTKNADDSGSNSSSYTMNFSGTGGSTGDSDNLIPDNKQGGNTKVTDTKGNSLDFTYLSSPDFLKAVGTKTSQSSSERFLTVDSNPNAVYDRYRQQSYSTDVLPTILSNEKKANEQAVAVKNQSEAVSSAKQLYSTGSTSYYGGALTVSAKPATTPTPTVQATSTNSAKASTVSAVSVAKSALSPVTNIVSTAKKLLGL